jgi:thioredoxin-like negative regulator of GroEL
MDTTDDRDFASTVLAAAVPTLVYFHADWSPPCRIMKTLVERAATQYAGRLVMRICDVARSPATEQAQIEAFELGVPCIVVFDRGNRAEVKPGAYAYDRLTELCDRWAK